MSERERDGTVGSVWRDSGASLPEASGTNSAGRRAFQERGHRFEAQPSCEPTSFERCEDSERINFASRSQLAAHLHRRIARRRPAQRHRNPHVVPQTGQPHQVRPRRLDQDPRRRPRPAQNCGGPRLHHPQAAGRLGVRGVCGGGRGALVGLSQEAVLRHARVRLRLRARPRRDAGARRRGGRARRGRRRDGGVQRHDPRVRADGDGQDAHDLRPALVLAAARRTSWIEPSASAAGSARAAQLQEGLLPQLELSGIVTRAALQIFATVDERRAADAARSMQFAVSLSSLQIYQESTSDLLADPAHSPPLQVRETPPTASTSRGSRSTR